MDLWICAVGQVWLQRSPTSQAPALRGLLLRLAEKGSRFFSLGCDLGAHEEDTDADIRFVAGGYVHIADQNFQTSPHGEYLRLAKSVSSYIEQKSATLCWRLRHEGMAVRYRLDGCNDICPSVQTRFFARAQSAPAALQSREALIEAMHAALNQQIADAST